MHSLSETSRKQHNHRSCIYHESTLQQDERRFFYICLAYAQNMWIMNSTCDMFIHKLLLMLSSSDLLVICIIIFLFIFNICIARILSFFLVYAQHMRTATLTVSHSNHLVNLLFHSLDFQRWCFHRSLMFLYAQLMLRICSVEILVIRYELFCDLTWWSWHMLRIGFKAFSIRRQILNVQGICYFSSSTRRQEIFSTPTQLFQPDELHLDPEPWSQLAMRTWN